EALVYWDFAWEQEIWPEGIFASTSSTTSADAMAGLARVAVRAVAAAISPIFAEVSFGISALCHICNIRETPSEAPRICEPVSHRRARSILGPLGRGAHRGCATGSWRWPCRGRGHASQSHKRGHRYRPLGGVQNVSRNRPLRAPALRLHLGKIPWWFQQSRPTKGHQLANALRARS